jgi:O-antigen ligase
LQTALSPAGKAFVGFLGFYLAMGTMVKPDRVQLISHINSIFLVVVAALATVYNAKRNTLPRFMILTSLIATAGAFTVYLSPLLGDLYSQIRSVERVNSTGRWMGFFANPNDTGFAAVLALALTLPVSAIAVKPNPIRRCKTFISIVLGIGVLLTFSRSAILAFLLCILINWLVTAKLNTKGVYAAVATTGLLLIIYWFFTIGYQAFEWTTEQEGRIESISRILTFQRASDSDLGHRMEGVTAGLAYFRESPIIGNGLGSMHRMPDKYFRGLGCHNTHLMVLGEVGILGFSLYLFALASYLRNTMQMREEAPRLFCLLLLVTFLLDGMVSHKVLDTRSYNLLLGVAFGLQVIFGSGRRP